ATEAQARTLVTALVAERLIACGTLVPGARSIYRWEGEVTEEGEVVVLLKTDVSRWDALCRAVRERHPYQVPELLALPVDRGLATDPDNVPLLVERATRLTAARHYRAAQRDLERALRSDPAHADALAALGVVLSRKGLWSEAVPLLRRVVDSEPGRAIAWY